MKLEYIVTKKDIDKTIKDILLNYFHISHRLLITLKKENLVKLNNTISKFHTLVDIGDVITIDFDYEEDNSNIIPKEMNLNIVYEDDWLLVINKEPNLPVHPSILHYEDSLSNGVKYYYDKIGLKKKIRPVNRIDKDTSGLVIFAKCEYIQEELIKQMKENKFKKEYIAIVEGLFDQKEGTINLPIARKNGSIIERCIDDGGAPSITEYEVLKENKEKNFSVVKCNLKTGRTHQIRVHFSYIGHPLLGDDLYGGKLDLINRQALHCKQILFTHPITNENLVLECNLPLDMSNII